MWPLTSHVPNLINDGNTIHQVIQPGNFPLSSTSDCKWILTHSCSFHSNISPLASHHLINHHNYCNNLLSSLFSPNGSPLPGQYFIHSAEKDGSETYLDGGILSFKMCWQLRAKIINYKFFTLYFRLFRIQFQLSNFNLPHKRQIAILHLCEFVGICRHT